MAKKYLFDGQELTQDELNLIRDYRHRKENQAINAEVWELAKGISALMPQIQWVEQVNGGVTGYRADVSAKVGSTVRVEVYPRWAGITVSMRIDLPGGIMPVYGEFSRDVKPEIVVDWIKKSAERFFPQVMSRAFDLVRTVMSLSLIAPTLPVSLNGSSLSRRLILLYLEGMDFTSKQQVQEMTAALNALPVMSPEPPASSEGDVS